MGMGIILRKEWFGGIIGDTHSYNLRVLNKYTFNLLKDYILNNVITDETNKLLLLLRVKGICVDNKLRIIENSTIEQHPILSAPIIVWLEVTDKCSLKCKQCFLNSESLNSGNTLPVELVEKVITELYQMGIYKVTITGGEPLFYNGLSNILALLNEKDIGVRIFTNGIVAKKNFEVLNNYKIDILFVSLDGYKIDNDFLRGKFSFNKILSSLKYLTRFSNIASIALSLTLNKSNVKSLEFLFKLASDLGIKTFLTRPLMIYPWCKNLEEDFLLTKEELINTLGLLDVLSHKYGIEYQINKIPFIPIKKKVFYDDQPSNASLWSILGIDDSIDCVGGNLVCGIRFNGIVIPCGFIKLDYELSQVNSILEKPFRWLWQHSPNLNRLRKISPNIYCNNCKLIQVCSGGCRANSFLLGRNIEGVDQYCIYHETSLGKSLASERNVNYKEILFDRKILDTPQIYISESNLVSKCGWATLETYYE